MAGWGLLVLIGCIQFALMPAFLIEGDAVAVRAITARLVHAGAMSIPAEATGLLEDFGQTTGQYYFLHPDGDRLYSKYGVLNTLLYVPPVWLHRRLTGIENPYVFSHSLVFLLNLYNLLFTLLIAHRLLRIASLYTRRRGTTWIYVLSCLYASFLWYYLRAQGGEIFQVFLFLCLYDHFARGLRGSKRDRVWAFAALSGLALLKSYYIILLPAMTVAGLRAGPSRPVAARMRSAGLTDVLPGTALVLILLGIHAWKFGSPFETGYSQFEPGAFSVLPRGEAILGFLARPDRSLFLHAPAVLLALFGWREFLRRHPHEAGFAGLAGLLVLLFVCCFANWPGHWCYGPRYLLILAPVLAIPLIFLLDRGALPLKGAALAVLVLGVAMQWQVIGKRFFLAYEVSGQLQEAGMTDLSGLTGNRAFPFLYRELDRFARHGNPGPVIRQVREELEPESAAAVEAQICAQLIGNYFWLRPVAPEDVR